MQDDDHDPSVVSDMTNQPNTTISWSIEDTRALAPEAFREALTRYPNDVEGALVFYSYAIGLGIHEPTAEDIAWAQKFIKDLHHGS